MLKIAHRGNIRGSEPYKENTKEYITDALHRGFMVEVDVWIDGGGFILGHDGLSRKQYVSATWFNDKNLLIHCKTPETFAELAKNPDLHLVYHEGGIASTSKGYLFTAPGLPITERSIAVMPELSPLWDFSKAYAVCTDYVMNYV